MIAWAESGYPGVFKPTYLDKSGKEITDKDGQAVQFPPNVKDEYWSKQKHAKEAPPDQSKVLRLPPSKTMDNIRAQAGVLLERTAQHPDLIRGECGEQLGKLNDTISNISAEYVEKYNSRVETEEERISSLTDQRIPDIRIFQMIVEFVEQMVSTGQDRLGDFPGIEKEYDLLKKIMSQAGHPPEWFDMIATTVSQKVALARKFNNEAPGRDYHEHADLWQSDLKSWLIKKVDTGERHSSNRIKAHQVESGNPASNQQPVSSEGPAPEVLRSPEPPNEGGMEGISKNVASTGQAPGVGGATAAPANPVLAEKVLYDGDLRSVGGVRAKGFGHQYLVRMNDETEANPYWLMIAASTFGKGEAKNYLDNGGYLVQSSKKKREADRKTRNLVEGTEEHLANRLGSHFVMKGIATEPRTSGSEHSNWPNQIIQGHFTDQNPIESKFYAFSTLGCAWGRKYVEEKVYKHILDNKFPMQAAPEKPRKPRSKPGQSNAVKVDSGTNEGSETKNQGNFMGKNAAHHDSANDGWILPVSQESETSLKALEERIMTEVSRRMETQSEKLQNEFSQKLAAGFESQKADMASQKNDIAELTSLMKTMMARPANVA